ncbi:MAG TPA: asparagine synthase (glutamine-hydrolyzing) [Azospirillaceae bacterium]|nr:asparagine synthase (glutamine-hydrolyzing) [Azospirillaceae bacterium]
MCGIAGFLGTRPLPDARIDACLKAMGRRGPDGVEAVHRELPNGRHAHLLHGRLRIIDLDPRANQPFALGNGELCYNGEIYNYREIRADFERQGHGFRTESDTEVLARLLSERGVDGLDEAEGMWAFAWLTRDGMYLSRDRFGEKPLYVHEAPEGLYFGSEPKFIFALLGRTLPVNLDHVRRYLVNGYKALYKRPRTFFQGLREVEPGTTEFIDFDGHRRVQGYWTPPRDVEDTDIGFEEAVGLVRTALCRSVELRLRADVPIAFCLSGGVDSNALIAIAKRQFGYDVHGFTVMNTDERYEERDMVEAAVRELGLRHTPIPLETDGFLDGMRTLVGYHDAPVYTITYYAQWRLMSAVAAHGYRVSVSGTGADELFSGYYDHHNFYIASLAGHPDLQAQARTNWQRHIAPIVRNPFLQDPDCFVKAPDLRDHIYLDAADFSEFLTTPWQESFEETDYGRVPLRSRMLNEMFHEAVPPLLHEDDLNAMYFSIENRSPFLDRNLFELCQRIPTRHLVHNGRAKAILREAVRGLAPDLVVDNPRKVGFNAPIFDYLDVTNPQVRQDLLADSPVFDVVRRDSITRLIDEPKLRNSQSKFLFYFVSTKMFMESFDAG